MPYWQYLGLSCRGAQAAEEQCGAAAYGGYEAMFRCDRHGADACYVATRPDSHRALCERLIARRVPTLCEKPLATSVDDVAALYAAAAVCFVAQARCRSLHFWISSRP